MNNEDSDMIFIIPEYIDIQIIGNCSIGISVYPGIFNIVFDMVKINNVHKNKDICE